MKGLAILLISFVTLTGCFFPTYYPVVPGGHYFPEPHASTQAYPEPMQPGVTTRPQAEAPAAAVAPPPGGRAPAAHDETMRRLRRERDAAQKALDDYTIEYSRWSLSPGAATPHASAHRRTSMPFTSMGLTLGARALDTPIDDSEVLATIGLAVTHHFAGSQVVLDLGLGYAGFISTDELADRYLTTCEASAGLRLMSSSVDHRRPNGNTVFYIGGGALAIAIDDTFDPVIGESFSEGDSATGGYACVGVHYRDNVVGCDFEVRKVMGTSYSTFGQEKSSDGIELLLRFLF